MQYVPLIYIHALTSRGVIMIQSVQTTTRKAEGKREREEEHNPGVGVELYRREEVSHQRSQVDARTLADLGFDAGG